MANPNLTDMTEEDAADLQFPKDCASSIKSERDIDLEVLVVKEEIYTSDPECRVCKSSLSEPYIRCATCRDVDICPICFSNGREVDEHKNDHDYVVTDNEFPLISKSSWTAKQELQLLDVLQECGFGNWLDISKRINVKSPEECKSHYLSHYIDKQSLRGLPKIQETRASLFPPEVVPYTFKLQDVEEPPRFGRDTANCRLLAGYNPARADFEVNYDHHAELLISDLKYDEFLPEDRDYDLGTSLQAAIVEGYNTRLRERKRRRKIIKDHGLIAFRKTISWLKRYDSTITRPLTERLLIFMQLVGGMDFDYIMESLHHAGELKLYIQRLLEFRNNGLKRFHSVEMFEKLSKVRQEYERERNLYMNNTEYSWKNILPSSNVEVNLPGSANICQRKPPPPLAIKGLPGCEKLTVAEKELCSVARVVPANYLDYKHLLITEYKKCGSLRLAQARVLLKIDVNKTRKIYDYLVESGYIKKPIT